LSDAPEVIAIGEIGLDYHYLHSPKEDQINAFEAFIRLARKKRLPVIVHSRDANKEVLNILRKQRAGDVGGVIHSFGGDMEQAKEAIELGFYLSVNGIVTFKNAQMLRDAVTALPVERLLIETDCPFLTPVPYRGKRNEPAFVEYVFRTIARIKGMDKERLSQILLENLKNAFGIDMHQTIAYVMNNRLYLNITNKCVNACTFCPKFHGDYSVGGYNLKLLKSEPTYEQIIQAVGDPSKYEEVVFVGFGEPAQRLDTLVAVSKWLRMHGAGYIRLDTDGLGNLFYNRDITPQLAQYIDAVSVSLNAPDAQTYARLCPGPYNETAYNAVIEFIKLAKQRFKKVSATMVELPGIDIDATRSTANSMGVPFRARHYYESSLKNKSD